MCIRKHTTNNVMQHKRAQATTEIAVFGVILLVIFAALLRYGVIYNAKQETQMYAFRKALDLAERRLHGEPIGNYTGGRKFASVNLNVMKNVYPASTSEGTAIDSTIADGHASVLLETEASAFGGSNGEPDELDDIGGTYYQVGDVMIAQDQYVQPAYVLVERKRNEDKIPKHPWDGITDWLDWGDKDEYDTVQPMPYREQEQYNNVTSQSYYNYTVSNSANTARQYVQTTTNSDIVFKPPAYDIAGLYQEMHAWDPDVNKVYHAIGPSNNPQDFVINVNKTITKEREWYTTK